MSPINDSVASYEMMCGNDKTKLTLKASVSKNEKLQLERNITECKIKGIILQQK